MNVNGIVVPGTPQTIAQEIASGWQSGVSKTTPEFRGEIRTFLEKSGQRIDLTDAACRIANAGTKMGLWRTLVPGKRKGWVRL